MTTAGYTSTDADVKSLVESFGEAKVVAIVLQIAYSNFLYRMAQCGAFPSSRVARCRRSRFNSKNLPERRQSAARCRPPRDLNEIRVALYRQSRASSWQMPSGLRSTSMSCKIGSKPSAAAIRASASRPGKSSGRCFRRASIRVPSLCKSAGASWSAAGSRQWAHPGSRPRVPSAVSRSRTASSRKACSGW